MSKENLNNAITLNDSEEIILLEEEDLEDNYINVKKSTKKNKNIKIKNNEEINIKLDNNLIDPKEKFIDAIMDDVNFLSKKRKNENKEMEIINPKRKMISKEFKLFYRLVEKYGLEKVLSSLCSSGNIISYNTVDKIMDKIDDTCGKKYFINNIIKTLYSLLKDNMNELENSFSFNNMNQQRIIFNTNKAPKFNLEFNKNNIIEISEEKEEKKENDEINISNKKLGLETHYNKSEEGKIYKYNIIYLLDGLIIYKCSDNECNGNGIFDLNTKKFKIQEKHDKRYEEHEYIKNGESDNDIVYKELISNNKYIDAQILFDDKTKIVRFYC